MLQYFRFICLAHILTAIFSMTFPVNAISTTNTMLHPSPPLKSLAIDHKNNSPIGLFSDDQRHANRVVSNLIGRLEIRAVLNDLQSENIQYILQTSNGTEYNLRFIDHAPSHLQTDDIVQIKVGYYESNLTHIHDLSLYSYDIIVLKKTSFKAIPDAFGPQRTIVFLFNFQDKPNDKPWTLDYNKNLYFNITNNMFYEFSYHQTTLVGVALDYYTIPINSTQDCNSIISNLNQSAANAAARDGIDLSTYRRKVYVFPYTTSCGWGGMATLGGNPSTTWLNGHNYDVFTAHELGHNLGLYHSRFLKCVGSSNEGDCTRLEGGDTADTMGTGNTHFNAFQKERLGWLNYNISPPIQTVSLSGNYPIYPMSVVDTHVKALKVLKTTLADGSNDYYYLEFRQGVGFDAPLASCSDCDFTKGILIHQGNSKNPNSSDLLDMSPDDGKMRVVALTPGNSFTDSKAPGGGVTFSVNSVSSSIANVAITFGQVPPPLCVRANPEMAIVPSTTQWVGRNGTANYQITLINKDNELCSASQFKLSLQNTNRRIIASLDNTILYLTPGSSANVNLKVTSKRAAPGTYSVVVTGVNSSATDKIAKVTALFGVKKMRNVT